MKLEDLILTDELCSLYQVESQFIQALHEREIIQITTVEQREYLHIERLSDFEKMRRLHYEMDINLEGLEAIHALLGKVQQLQTEKRRLRNRLQRYEL